jgi:hypothetical protein
MQDLAKLLQSSQDSQFTTNLCLCNAYYTVENDSCANDFTDTMVITAQQSVALECVERCTFACPATVFVVSGVLSLSKVTLTGGYTESRIYVDVEGSLTGDKIVFEK